MTRIIYRAHHLKTVTHVTICNTHVTPIRLIKTMITQQKITGDLI